MKKAHVEDHRRIKLEKVQSPDYIGFLEGRPEREKVIRHEDSVNLQIAFNTCKSFEEFLGRI